MILRRFGDRHLGCASLSTSNYGVRHADRVERRILSQSRVFGLQYSQWAYCKRRCGGSLLVSLSPFLTPGADPITINTVTFHPTNF